ncbi:PadR family transcriptional regulator [Phenylobacterium sp. LH3H17]|uniref:PadR family transcriptional regulator n=1 Tax=Phenylobacterium sp. LH3H17 TaxID=2903901 RepID=UPI0020C99B6E|nr:PadR family transcriptional regulator [Phenylobacterium sp. LH3H17]UTP39486.1 PadR family transcriptional regulator [Phenylobacterium sp. LH3H17]
MYRHHWKQHEQRSRHAFGGHGHGGHRRGGPGRGGRIGRILDHGDLRFVILALLKEKPSHGYELIRALEERTGGAYRPSPGVIYPTLSLLEDEGFVRQTGGDGGRKAYEITPEGDTALEQNRAAVDAVFARLDEAGEQSPRSSPRVARAMQNLGVALKLRLQGERPSEAQIDAIAAAIDAAAAKIERV